MIKANTTGISIPLRAAAELISLPAAVGRDNLAEIRLRAGRRAVAVTVDGGLFPCSGVLGREELRRCFDELCCHSLHSFSREIREGYITLSGGHRVGFCGSAAVEGDGSISALKDIGSMNIRLARQVIGCGEALSRRLYGDGLKSVLVAGAPMSGKTTLLRDLTRLLGARYTVALIDSRCEIAACTDGAPNLDVGENTDVLSGYPRLAGMSIALRSLSPRVLVCDELLGEHDAVRQCARCGVKLLASAHAGSIEELRGSALRELLPLFDRVALLREIGGAAEVYETGELLCV